MSATRAMATGMKIPVARPWMKRTRANSQTDPAQRYPSGLKAKKRPDNRSNLPRPIRSDSIPAGRLTSTPASGDREATRPMALASAPRDSAKNGRTGFLAMVVPKMARNPVRHSRRNGESLMTVLR